MVGEEGWRSGGAASCVSVAWEWGERVVVGRGSVGEVVLFFREAATNGVDGIVFVGSVGWV